MALHNQVLPVEATIVETPAHPLAAAAVNPANNAPVANVMPVAVIVFHGMGEQVRFETVGDLAKSMLRDVPKPIKTSIRVIRPADSFLTRAEIGWTDRNGVAHEVHLYEAYWAPLTEGQVTYAETLWFLLQAGFTGIRHSKLFRACTFERWMFGRVVDVPIPGTTQLYLWLMLAFISGIAIAIALIGMKAAKLVKDLSVEHITLRTLWHTLVLFHGHPWWSIVFWIALAVSYALRYFIVQYVGDVNAYVSPFKASKFQNIRDNIQKVGIDVASVVYGFTDSLTPRYEKIVLAGHSLGSVVAYDTLNAMINRDITAAKTVDVVGRTRALITFGSPLDKTAFLFRNQANTLDDPLREQMAASAQPLIVTYDNRGPNFIWTNIYSRMDIISGSLEAYDLPTVDPTTGIVLPTFPRVTNVVDPEASIPVMAHVQYWKNPMLSSVLLNAVTT